MVVPHDLSQVREFPHRESHRLFFFLLFLLSQFILATWLRDLYMTQDDTSGW